MCWNKEVSLNTFIFSTISLLFIYYNNTHTQYKLKEFINIYIYIIFKFYRNAAFRILYLG